MVSILMNSLIIIYINKSEFHKKVWIYYYNYQIINHLYIYSQNLKSINQ